MKQVGKATRPFRYDLNQIPYDYTVKVRNRFKGLHLIDRAPDDLPQQKEMQKGKKEALQIAVKRREAKSKGEKERYKHLNAEFQRIARRENKALLTNQ